MQRCCGAIVAAHESGSVQVFGCRHAETIPRSNSRRPKSAKARNRGCGHRQCSEAAAPSISIPTGGCSCIFYGSRQQLDGLVPLGLLCGCGLALHLLLSGGCHGSQKALHSRRNAERSPPSGTRLVGAGAGGRCPLRFAAPKATSRKPSSREQKHSDGPLYIPPRSLTFAIVRYGRGRMRSPPSLNC
jgi:hypothetical protein